VAQPLGTSLEEAALAIKNNIDQAMASELAAIKQEIGPDFDPLLVVYGGAGPAHICDIASAAGLKKIVMTPYSAVFSAFSSLSMDVGHIYYRRVELNLDDAGLGDALAGAWAGMQEEALRDMRGEGFAPDDVAYALELLMQPAEGGQEVKIAAPVDSMRDAALLKEAEDRARVELAALGWEAGSAIKLSTVSLLAQAAVHHYEFPKSPAADSDVKQAIKGERPVFMKKGGQAEPVPVYDRALLGNGHSLRGPALVESEHTTVYVPTGWGLSVDQYNNSILEEV
jgi:N-methylhydantoinase A/acetophenone carboxylase